MQHKQLCHVAGKQKKEEGVSRYHSTIRAMNKILLHKTFRYRSSMQSSLFLQLEAFHDSSFNSMKRFLYLVLFEVTFNGD